jgi:zinc transport system substrate-binding protein
MIFMRTLLISVVALIAACDGADRQASSDGAAVTKPDIALVISSNYPLYFFARRITDGVDGAPEIVLPDIDGDPASWTPGAEQIQLLQSAEIILLNGAGAESWLNLITLDHRRLLDTSVNITNRLIPLEGDVVHQHGPEGEHSHQGHAFTTWLDPQLAIAQAQIVTETLVELDPAGAEQFRDNMAKLEEELAHLDTRLAEVLAELDGRPILFSHPVYQYLERRYGINGESVHWEPDEEPTTAAWIAMQQILATHPATIMIWEDEPLMSTAQRLSDAGITSVPWHTVASRPGHGNYLSVMRDNAERLESLIALTELSRPR